MKSLVKVKLFFYNKLSLFLTLSILLVYLILFFRFSFSIPRYVFLSSTVEPLTFSYNPETRFLADNDNVGFQPDKTTLKHIMFGIAASSSLWHKRKSYIELWWKPRDMRGFVWLDKTTPVDNNNNTQIDSQLMHPPIRISSETYGFKYTRRGGHRSAIRISRIVSETVRLGLADVRWYVMGDDDTFFVAENLVRVLEKLDHDQFYYVGGNSESHDQNIRFSYNMAYGGGGFAISHALAKALAKMQDGCIKRHPALYGSDDRIHACMAELGVPVTKHAGFHQFDVYGSLFGLLTAHPVTSLVSLHHLDIVAPIFPKADRVQALRRLTVAMRLDSAALMQHSICYDKAHNWTVSVSWGYAVQIFSTIKSARVMEMPARTFKNWYRNYHRGGYAFNTRSFGRNQCQKPAIYYLFDAVLNEELHRTGTEYLPHPVFGNPWCETRKDREDPAVLVDRVEVHKTPDPQLW
uniref:Uncharacterized protein n=1 Tax=Kalanchoe fedtschenkoi TaxID=63787 RepID=A0A7N0TCI1_KALFE